MLNEGGYSYEYPPYSQHLLEYAHSQNYLSGSEGRGSDTEGPYEEQGSDILSPMQYGNSNYLMNESSFDSSTSNKAKIFIKTKVTAMKLPGLNLLLENQENYFGNSCFKA